MIAAEALADWLHRRPSVDGATIVGWRFEVVEGQGVRAGVRDSRLGGPYEGPGVASRLGGSLELHWSDGLLTRAGLDRQAIVDPASELAAWRTDAVPERQGRLPPLAAPTPLPQVEVRDPAVEGAVESGALALLHDLPTLVEGITSAGVGRIDAVMRASRSQRSVMTSLGFRAGWHETSCAVQVWGDEIAGASYCRRRLPARTELDRLIDKVSGLAPLLSRASVLPGPAQGVLFMPSVVHGLLARLLLPNLSGRAIRDGRSPFTRADLESGRRVLRADLDVVVDTTLPWELATAPCSADGVLAGRVALIASGRLSSPILDLATAEDFGLPATPAPRGWPAALLRSEQPALEPGDALALLRNGVVVRELPGLHTQQPRRAAYALVVPDAQVVANGRAGGRCAVRLAGNLMAHLNHPLTRLVRLPGDRVAGLLVPTGVELLPA